MRQPPSALSRPNSVMARVQSSPEPTPATADTQNIDDHRSAAAIIRTAGIVSGSQTEIDRFRDLLGDGRRLIEGSRRCNHSRLWIRQKRRQQACHRDPVSAPAAAFNSEVPAMDDRPLASANGHGTLKMLCDVGHDRARVDARRLINQTTAFPTISSQTCRSVTRGPAPSNQRDHVWRLLVAGAGTAGCRAWSPGA